MATPLRDLACVVFDTLPQYEGRTDGRTPRRWLRRV